MTDCISVNHEFQNLSLFNIHTIQNHHHNFSNFPFFVKTTVILRISLNHERKTAIVSSKTSLPDQLTTNIKPFVSHIKPVQTVHCFPSIFIISITCFFFSMAFFFFLSFFSFPQLKFLFIKSFSIASHPDSITSYPLSSCSPRAKVMVV